MRYREEVEEAVRAAIEKIADGIVERENGKLKLTGVQPALRELVTLGVKLGLEAAAVRLDEMGATDAADAAAEIRDIHPGYVLQVQP